MPKPAKWTPAQRAAIWRGQWLPVIWCTAIAAALGVAAGLTGPSLGWEARVTWPLAVAGVLLLSLLMLGWRLWVVALAGAHPALRIRLRWLAVPFGVGSLVAVAVFLGMVKWLPSWIARDFTFVGFCLGFLLASHRMEVLERRAAHGGEMERIAQELAAGRSHLDFAPMMSRKGLDNVLDAWPTSRLHLYLWGMMASCSLVFTMMTTGVLSDRAIAAIVISGMAVWFGVMLAVAVASGREDQRGTSAGGGGPVSSDV